jgi:hypothetical protein
VTLNKDARTLENWMHARVARAFRITELSDFEARVLSKGYVTREDYDEAYRLYADRMTAAGFIVERLVDDRGYYIQNYSSRRRDGLFARGDPADEASRLDEEERAISVTCEIGTFRLINAIFHEQSEPSSQFDD